MNDLKTKYAIIALILSLSIQSLASDEVSGRFAKVAARYRSTVVKITTIKRNPDSGNESSLAGTGFFINHKEILTNGHVIIDDIDESKVDEDDLRKFQQREYRYWIEFKDLSGKERKIEAFFVGTNPKTDVGLIRVGEENLNIIPATLGNSKKVTLGEEIVVIGHPFADEATVTVGIISQLDQEKKFGEIPSFHLSDMFGINVTFNPGNSGSPIINLEEEVIAIGNGGRTENLNVAIPMYYAIRDLDRMRKEGRITPGWTGIRWMEEKLVKSDRFIDLLELSKKIPAFETFKKEDAVALDKLTAEINGALIVEVEKDSPADKAGVKKSDMITRFDGKEIKDYKDLFNFIAETPIGTLAAIEILRIENGKVNKVTLNLEVIKKSRPKPD